MKGQLEWEQWAECTFQGQRRGEELPRAQDQRSHPLDELLQHCPSPLLSQQPCKVNDKCFKCYYLYFTDEEAGPLYGEVICLGHIAGKMLENLYPDLSSSSVRLLAACCGCRHPVRVGQAGWVECHPELSAASGQRRRECCFNPCFKLRPKHFVNRLIFTSFCVLFLAVTYVQK